jgi:hypothetical protein
VCNREARREYASETRGINEKPSLTISVLQQGITHEITYMLV